MSLPNQKVIAEKNEKKGNFIIDVAYTGNSCEWVHSNPRLGQA